MICYVRTEPPCQAVVKAGQTSWAGGPPNQSAGVCKHTITENNIAEQKREK